MNIKSARAYWSWPARKALLAIGAVSSIAATVFSCQLPLPAIPIGGAIHGHVAVFLRGGKPGEATSGRIELPGAEVTAKNIATGITSPAVSTNAHGYFQIPRLVPGSYQVCASAPGFAPSCIVASVAVSSFAVILPEDVSPLPKEPVIAGSVLLTGNTPCFTDRPAFRTFVSAKVTLEDANRNTAPCRGTASVNSFCQPCKCRQDSISWLRSAKAQVVGHLSRPARR